MNKKILYKLLLIFAILAFTLLISNTKSFATDYTDDVYNSSYIQNSGEKLQSVYEIIDNNQDIFNFSSSDLPEYQVLVKIKTDVEGVYNYSFYSFSVPVYDDTTAPTHNNKSFAFRYKFASTPYTYKYFNLFIKDTGLWVSLSTIKEETSSSSTLVANYSLSNTYEIVNSNFDVLDETGNVVFQQPPQVQEQVTTLAPIVEGMETEKTLAEIVAILPVVLVVIVGLLAMRKAIAFLMKTLKQG